MLNPYTRQPFNKDVQDKILEYKQEKDITLTVLGDGCLNERQYTFPYYTQVGDVVVNIITDLSKTRSCVVYIVFDLVSKDGFSLKSMDMETELSQVTERTFEWTEKKENFNKNILSLVKYCNKTKTSPYDDKSIIVNSMREFMRTATF
jgi:hypothetical protein